MSENQVSEAPQPVGEKIQPDRPPCDLLLFDSANKFATAMLQNIPELQGIAIVPLWVPKLQNVPSGILRLRNEAAPYIASLLQMLINLSTFSSDVHRDLMVQFRAVDQMAHNLAEEIKARTAELDALSKQKQEKTQ